VLMVEVGDEGEDDDLCDVEMMVVMVAICVM
jgi:hypothetical protein